MANENQSGETTFGYLSAVEAAEYGYFGGYLIVCALGRPLEFHCTSPVRPSRAQEILYGPTLRPYLLGEQIGGTLLRAAKLTPELVFTDQSAMLTIRTCSVVPIVQLMPESDGQAEPVVYDRHAIGWPASDGSGTAGGSLSSHVPITGGGYQLQLPPGFESDRRAVVELLAKLAPQVDLAEPFGRIHEAIREAQRIGGRALESHDEAA